MQKESREGIEKQREDKQKKFWGLGEEKGKQREKGEGDEREINCF